MIYYVEENPTFLSFVSLKKAITQLLEYKRTLTLTGTLKIANLTCRLKQNKNWESFTHRWRREMAADDSTVHY